MSTALFVCGPAGCGKTTFAKALVPLMNKRTRRPWCLLDKDTVSGLMAEKLMEVLTGSGLDRDSPTYMAHVRDKEYQAVLQVARENLNLGVNVILPAPWSTEIKSGALFNPAALGFCETTQTLAVWLHASEDERLDRIIARGNPRDQYKLNHWSSYVQSLGNIESSLPPGMIMLDATLPLAELASAILPFIELE